MTQGEAPEQSYERDDRRLMDRRDFLKKSSLVIAGGAILAAGLPAAEAQAVTYRTRFSSIPVRNGPSILSTKLATLGNGVAVNVGSQTGGSRLGSGTHAANATWCRLTDGRWIHDYHLDTAGNGNSFSLSDGLAGYVLFTSGLSRTTPSILGRSTRDAAAWWAETQLGVTAYSGLCLAFTRDAWRFGANYDFYANTGGDESAQAKWNWLRASSTFKGQTSTSSSPPRGAVVFWSWKTDGHAAISAGLVSGAYHVVSSYYGASQTISWAKVTTVTSTLSSTSKYLGWWLPK